MAKARKQADEEPNEEGQIPGEGLRGTFWANADGTYRFQEDGVLSKHVLAVKKVGAQPEPDLPALVEALSLNDQFAPGVAGIYIGKAGPAAIPLLEAALDTDRVHVRCNVIYALSKVVNGSTKTVPILTEQLGHRDPTVRAAAAEALCSLGTSAKRAAPALKRLIDDPDPIVQENVLRALTWIGRSGKHWLNILRRKLSCDDEDILLVAVTAVGELGPDGAAAIPELTMVYERDVFRDVDDDLRIAVCKAWRQIGKAAIPAIVAQLYVVDDNLFIQELTNTLVQIGPDAAEAIPELAILSKHKNRIVQIYAAYAMGQLGARTDRYLPLLIDCLKDSDPEARGDAAYALSRIGPSAAKSVPHLVKALSDKQRNVRSAAAEALGAMGDKAKRAVPALRRACGDESSYVRISAAKAIGKIGPGAKAAVPTLIELLKHEDRHTASAATRALGQVQGGI